MKIALVLGTRPEIIKLSPIIRYCELHKIPFFIVHSGQHYSPNMDSVFFKELKLPQPKYNLHIGKLEFRKRIGFCVHKLMRILEDEWPDVVLVEGDTLTVLIGALAAKKLDRPVAHIESGLRSHDLSMPEENYRIITDHIAEFLYPPTADAARNLLEEGIEKHAAPVFGNTVVDAVLQNVSISEEKKDVLQSLGIQPQAYVLVTAHRQENVDRKERLAGIMEGLSLVHKAHPELSIIFPIHPRTSKMLEQFGITRPKGVRFIEPLGYLEFLQLEKNASLIITDSGGLQEEATVFHVPCVTVRDNTERPETITHGMNMLAGTNKQKILACANTMLKKRIQWKAVYGNGTSAERTLRHLEAGITKRKTTGRVKWLLRSIARVLKHG